MAVLAQLSGPKKATKPEHVDWPEVQPLAEQAGRAYARNGAGHMLAIYLTEVGWERNVNEETGAVERSTPAWLFLERRGGALVKGEQGESQVCFQHACALVQASLGGEWSAPGLDCDEQRQVKVTCDSVRAFTNEEAMARIRERAAERRAEQAERPAPAAAPPPAPAPAPGPVPPQVAPFGTYRGNLVASVRVDGKLRQDSVKVDVRLSDRGAGRVEVDLGDCQVQARKVGRVITFAPGQRCKGRTMRGTLTLKGTSGLELEMSSTAEGQPTAEGRGLLRRRPDR